MEQHVKEDMNEMAMLMRNYDSKLYGEDDTSQPTSCTAPVIPPETTKKKKRRKRYDRSMSMRYISLFSLSHYPRDSSRVSGASCLMRYDCFDWVTPYEKSPPPNVEVKLKLIQYPS